MKKYKEYKDSGIALIGEIPSEWEVKRLKNCFEFHKGGAWGEEATGDSNDYICVRVADFDYKSLCVNSDDYTVRNFNDAQVKKLQLVKGDLLIEKSGGGENSPVGRVVIFDKDFNALYANFIEAIRVSKNGCSIFYNYLFASLYSKGINRKFYSQTTGIQNLNVTDYLNEAYPIPPLQIQQAIADYLDRKTAGIGTLIADKQKLIDLLREKRQATINEAVTKGLDKTVKMKDSGIDWIGEIPAHWDVLSNHQLFVERNQKNTDANAELLSVTKYLGVILQSLAQELRLATTAPADSTEGYKIVKKGDLVMNIMRAKDGSYGISSYDGVISPAYCIYQARKKCNPQFLYYLFKTPEYVQIFKCYSTGIAEHRMRLYPEDFNQIPAILPPIAEQDEIVKKLDEESKEIDEVIALIEEQIEKLKEYSLSIISEAVTGKVVV